MEHTCRLVAPFGLGIAPHVEGDAVTDVCLRAHAGDGFLPLAVTAVAAFPSVGGRRQALIVKEREGLFPVGTAEVLEGLPDLREAADSSAQLGERLQGCRAPTAAVKATIDFVQNLPQRMPLLMSVTEPRKGRPRGRGQEGLDAKAAVVEEVGDVRPQRRFRVGLVRRGLRRRPAARELG